MTDPMPRVYVGELGWSNKRGGVEFYQRMPDGTNGRHSQASTFGGEKWGALLVEQIDPQMRMEGGSVVVIVFPSRFTKPAEVDAMADAVRSLIEPQQQEDTLWGRLKAWIRTDWGR